MKTITPGSAKTRFETRLPEQMKLLFEKAATYGGYTSLSEFILSTVQTKALEIIKEHEIIILSQRDREVFFDTIVNPPQPNEALKRAAKNYFNYIENGNKQFKQKTSNK